jgi:sugar lactone lactonase YvrE
MKSYPIKNTFYIALLIFSIGCMVSACTKKDFKQVSTVTITKSDSDSAAAVAALDSLPSFYSPSAVAVDASGNLYVADYGNNLIREITPGGLVSTLAGSGNQGSINAKGVLASFSQPTGVGVDASGNVYVADADNNLIREITPGGLVTTLAGGDTTGTVNGPGAIATFDDPAGVALDGLGNIYVADAGNDLIRLINSAGTVSTFTGNGIGTVAVNTFNNSTGVAADASGNVFVANYLNSNILEVNSAGVNVLAGTAGQSGAANGPGSSATFYYPSGVAVDAADNVYVADQVNNLIRKITPGGIVSTLAGSGNPGAIDSTGVAASFNGPSGLAVDASGNVYVADSNNNLIRKITPAGVVTTVAGNGLSGAKNGQAVARRNKKIIAKSAKVRLNIFYRRRI